MARFALLLTICAALLSACSTYSTPASRPAQPNGKPVFITLQVEQHLSKYYRTIGGGRSGAFGHHLMFPTGAVDAELHVKILTAENAETAERSLRISPRPLRSLR